MFSDVIMFTCVFSLRLSLCTCLYLKALSKYLLLQKINVFFKRMCDYENQSLSG